MTDEAPGSEPELVEVAPGHRVALVAVPLAPKRGFEPPPSLVPSLRARGVRWIVLHPHRDAVWASSGLVSRLMAEAEELRAEGGDLFFVQAGVMLKIHLEMLAGKLFFFCAPSRGDALAHIARRCDTSQQ